MTVTCEVKSINPLASNIYKVILQPAEALQFKAGQYLMVIMGKEDKRPFSIANSPTCSTGELELHIGSADHNSYASEVVELMTNALNNKKNIEIDAPFGNAWFRENSQSPILLVAGGTGFSYVRSILDYCVEKNVSEPMYVYWGAKNANQLYAKEELEFFVQRNSHISFIPVIEQADDHWLGKVGNVLDAVESDFSSLNGVDIYLAGRFEMASIARDRFTQNKAAQSDRMFSDAYSFI